MMNPIHIIYNYHFFIRVKIESMKTRSGGFVICPH